MDPIPAKLPTAVVVVDTLIYGNSDSTKKSSL